MLSIYSSQIPFILQKLCDFAHFIKHSFADFPIGVVLTFFSSNRTNNLVLVSAYQLQHPPINCVFWGWMSSQRKRKNRMSLLKNFTPDRSRDGWRGRRELLSKARARWFWRYALDRVLHDGLPSCRCKGWEHTI